MQANTQPAFIIRPNANKLCILNVIKVVAAATIFVAVVTYLGTMIDFSIIGETFDISTADFPSTQQVIVNFGLGAVFAAMIAFLLTHLTAGKKQYVFYQDRLVMYVNFMIFNVSEKAIPLANIVSVNFEKKGEKSLLGMGQVILQLSGMEQTSISLDDVDQPEYYVPYIQRLLENSRQQMRQQFTFENKVENTLSQI